MDFLSYDTNAYYVFERCRIDYSRLFKIDQHSAYFVIRAKNNLKFKRMYSKKHDRNSGVKSDRIGKLQGFCSFKEYPKKIRRVKFYDEEKRRTFVFLTNNFDLSANQIAYLYKNRWQVELFFKWIKQHLKIKSFWGTSKNAVRIQTYTAIIPYCLVAIVRSKLQIERSPCEILQVLGISLLDKTPVKELFTNSNYNNVKDRFDNQPSLSLF